MRVAILTSGRFHVMDLARELDALGHDVSFYSAVPRPRTRRFGLPDRCNKWLGPWVAPALAFERLSRGTRLEPRGKQALNEAIDLAASRLIGPCDALIAMSGMSRRTIEAVRKRHGARVYLERSSRHILSQKAILEAIPGRPADARPAVPEWAIRRELVEYELADTVVVPARHVLRSFLERGYPEARLFRNPFGTSLSQFPPTPAPPAGTRRIIMAGSWSYQKGCDVLVDAFRQLDGAELVHVGAVCDAPLPRGLDGFRSVGFVPQRELTAHYAQATVFALPSRQEGLAVVQVQAVASGLRLVCSDRSGGEDLRDFIPDPGLVSVVPPEDPAALAAALDAALDAPALAAPGELRDPLGDRRDQLSWAAYARRWDARLTADR